MGLQGGYVSCRTAHQHDELRLRCAGFIVRCMDWERVRIFLEIARSGQILEAAKRLRINHATVARQLTALETELKVKLVERNTVGCTLTSAGEAPLHAAERAEAEFLRVGAQLSGTSSSLNGTVRVGRPMVSVTTFLRLNSEHL